MDQRLEGWAGGKRCVKFCCDALELMVIRNEMSNQQLNMLKIIRCKLRLTHYFRSRPGVLSSWRWVKKHAPPHYSEIHCPQSESAHRNAGTLLHAPKNPAP